MLALVVLALTAAEPQQSPTAAPPPAMTVVVYGKLTKPGPVDLRAGAMLSDALATGGIRIPPRSALNGMTIGEAALIIGRCVNGADVTRILVMRDQKTRQVDMSFGHSEANDLALIGGDRIFVPECFTPHGKQIAQSAAPSASQSPWRPRPVIIIDPKQYLASPTPRASSKRAPTPHPHATPHRRPISRPTPETFMRLDTSPPPATRSPAS